MCQPHKCSYSYFSRALELYLRALFPCEYPYVFILSCGINSITCNFSPFKKTEKISEKILRNNDPRMGFGGTACNESRYDLYELSTFTLGFRLERV